MWRNILAVIAGFAVTIPVMFVVGGLIFAVGHLTSPEEFPFPPTEDWKPPSNPMWLVASLGMDFLMGVGAGYVATWIARKPAHTLIYVFMSLMAVGCIVTLFTADWGKLPLWVSVARIVVAPLGVLSGATLRGMGSRDANPRPYDMREKNMAC